MFQGRKQRVQSISYHANLLLLDKVLTFSIFSIVWSYAHKYFSPVEQSLYGNVSHNSTLKIPSLDTMSRFNSRSSANGLFVNRSTACLPGARWFGLSLLTEAFTSPLLCGKAIVFLPYPYHALAQRQSYTLSWSVKIITSRLAIHVACIRFAPFFHVTATGTKHWTYRKRIICVKSLYRLLAVNCVKGKRKELAFSLIQTQALHYALLILILPLTPVPCASSSKNKLQRHSSDKIQLRQTAPHRCRLSRD